MPRMLILSFVEWAGAFQRPQHMAVGFARAGWDVTYVSPGYVHRRGKRVASGVDLPASLLVIQPTALPGAGRLPIIQSINLRIAARRLKGLCGGSSWDAVIFNDPRWAPLAAELPANRRIFDAMDDLSAYAGSAAAALRAEERALKTADRIWTGTAMMADRLGPRHGQVRFIPCGVDGERFSCPDPAAVEDRRRELAGVFANPSDAPLAGYFGALNERLDAELIRETLDAGWRVLLIGPPDTRCPALPDDARLVRLGPRPYAELPSWLATMDAALIPYRTDGANRFLYPVKALEYLAGDKPVLSSPLPDMVRLLGDYVTMPKDAVEWRNITEQWRAGIPEEVHARTRAGQAYALGRSWETMIGEMATDLT